MRDTKIIYSLKYPDVNSYCIERALAGKSNEEIRAELLQDLKDDKVSYISVIKSGSIYLDENFNALKTPDSLDNLLCRLGRVSTGFF